MNTDKTTIILVCGGAVQYIGTTEEQEHTNYRIIDLDSLEIEDKETAFKVYQADECLIQSVEDKIKELTE